MAADPAQLPPALVSVQVNAWNLYTRELALRRHVTPRELAFAAHTTTKTASRLASVLEGLGLARRRGPTSWTVHEPWWLPAPRDPARALERAAAEAAQALGYRLHAVRRTYNIAGGTEGPIAVVLAGCTGAWWSEASRALRRALAQAGLSYAAPRIVIICI